MVYEDSSIMPFGKYKGKRMDEVPASYLLWMEKENRLKGGVLDYVKNNYDLLIKERSIEERDKKNNLR